MDNSITLCEIADELPAEHDHVDAPSVFTYAKKRWRLKEFLNSEADLCISCIQRCEAGRTRKLCFKAVPEGQLLLVHQQTQFLTRSLELQVAAKLLPLVFKNYIPSLEFEVAQQEAEHQRPLKTYVTNKLYDLLYEKHLKARENRAQEALVMPECFQSQLRQYQQRTVQWMLEREQQPQELPANYTALQAEDGRHWVFKHNYCLEFYAYEATLPSIHLPPGGILADEMGLGKTVEFLALVLLNPRQEICFDHSYWLELMENLKDELPLKRRRLNKPKLLCICAKKSGRKLQCISCQLWQHEKCMQMQGTEPHICPNCWLELGDSRLVESRATFIVSPVAIKMQWYHEIRKHISPSLKILLYSGLHSGCWHSPLELAQYDVVLTDYSILGKEIFHTMDYHSNRKMRHQQRYMRPSSPLLMVNWWRVCLDEAQMVESSTSQAAEMVRKLPACNRWAVTGTIDELPPLLEFVGFQQACRPLDAWHTVDKSFQLNKQPEHLLNLLQHSLWRTCKSKVEHELGIPPQTEVVHRLDLSNVESLYYREEHFKCQEQFLAAVAKHTHINHDNSSRLASISSQLLKLILKPFLRIRQTCSVPVVLNSNVSSVNYLNPLDLLIHLKLNNELECKTELRTWSSSYNGMAAIYFIRKDYHQSIKCYKLLLKLAHDYQEEHISVDSVLQIHALYNMLQASDLASPSDKLSPENYHSYQVQMKKLEWKYLEDNTKVMQNVRQTYESKLLELNQMQQQFPASSLVPLFATLVNHSTTWHDAIWNKMLDECFRQSISLDKLENVRSVSGLVYIIDIWYQRLNKLNKLLETELDNLNGTMMQACGAVQRGESLTQQVLNFIRNVSDCHLVDILDDKPTDKPKKPKQRPKCHLCQIRDSLNQFECLLFAKELGKEATVTDGLEKPSMEISLIKIIFTFLRSKTEFAEYQKECQNQLDLLTGLQSLVKLQIKYWIEVEYVIKAFDELEMSKMRILLTDNPEEQSNYRILQCQLDEQMQFNVANVHEAQLNFTRLCGRLKYLKHLKEDTTSENEKPCPICQTQDDERYVMMVCGHFVCQHCLDSMRRKVEVTKCPLCRQDSPQLYYYSVRLGAHKSIVGDFSTKIAYIVELILKIKAAENEEKVLIFSQWQDILKHIARALALNGIEYRSKCNNRDFEEFKDPQRKVTCLLMPLSRGAKGLNLIEATHVFLVEPILNPGDERQAVGRLHRFGQTKPTKVHRFIVNNTIEANIMSLITSADDTKTLATHWDLENMTLNNLKDLFILKDKE